MKVKRSLPDLELENLAYKPREIAEWRLALSGRVVAGLEKTGEFTLNHWLACLNALNSAGLVGALLAPVLEWWQLAGVSRSLYWFYSWLCLQRPTHSFFLAGYQMGMEVRMMAIGAGGVAAGFLFTTRAGHRLAYRLSSWWSYLLLTLPLLFDVFSQTFGWRGSEWYWRGSSGLIFGMASVWFFYTRFEERAGRFRNQRRPARAEAGDEV